jgi:hypothetical protein
VARRYNGFNNGEIGLSIRGAARECRISKSTAGRALKELQEKGFLRLTTPASFSYKLRHAPEWAMTEYSAGSTPATKELARWQAPQKKARSQNRPLRYPGLGPMSSP